MRLPSRFHSPLHEQGLFQAEPSEVAERVKRLSRLYAIARIGQMTDARVVLAGDLTRTSAL